MHALRAYSITETAKAREAAVEAETRRLAEEEARRLAEEEARRLAEEEARRLAEEEARRRSRRKPEDHGSSQRLPTIRSETATLLPVLPPSRTVYGDPLLWPLLYQGNRDQIKDPRQIYVGQILNIPRGLMASDLEAARQKAREAGIFELPGNGEKPSPPR